MLTAGQLQGELAASEEPLRCAIGHGELAPGHFAESYGCNRSPTITPQQDLL